MYKFIDMQDRPLKFPVKCRNKIVIPAGTKHVKIAFNQSHLTRFDENDLLVPLNVYSYKGKIYHA